MYRIFELNNAKNTNFLSLGNKCNNNCWFCTNDEKNNGFKKLDKIKKEIEELDKEDTLVLYGEPTIHPKILEVIDIIKKEGNETITFLTNARMFSSIPFCEKIISAGINSFIVKINGHNEQIHDSLTRVENSFSQTTKGIKNLLSLGAEVSALITITEQNFVFLPKIIKKIKEIGIKEILLTTIKANGKSKNNYEKLAIRFSDIISTLNNQIESLDDIYLEGIPKCIRSIRKIRYSDFSLPIKEENKISGCEECIKKHTCQGIEKDYLRLYGNYEVTPVSHPEEIAIETNYVCNLDCPLCFNQNYVKKDKEYYMHIGKIKKIIDNIPLGFVSHIRITGGEPLLRKDIFEIMEYIKEKGFKVWLNTNGTLIDEKTAAIISKYVENVLIPLNGYDEKTEIVMTKKGMHKDKINGIRLLKKHGIPTVRCGTILTKENISNLDKFYLLALELNLDDWEVYRPIPNENNKEPINKKDMDKAIKKLYSLNKIHNKSFKLVNAIPFCVTDKKIASRVCVGAEADDGHIRFVIGPDGIARPSYYLNEKIGNIEKDSVKDIWNNKFMKDMRNLKFLPKECKGCEYIKTCRGGSRFCANLINNDYACTDPLTQSYKTV